ncbi:alpha-taxilin isoform X2 [Anabrus simplex]|uniref:alpha-taxilin isoform X2 n=1 Tax=Anabrus simplex TaxID=316456 RepID=UPI0035A342C3
MESLVENKTADDQKKMGDTVNIVPVKEDSKIANKDIETKLPSESAPSRRNTKEEKARKKDDRNVEQVLKALNSLETTEEKLAAMCKKYADTVDENRKLQLSLKQTEKRLIILQREKEQLQTEHSKAVLTRSRLESLCRELQRQNKAVKDESLLKIREEEEKRKEVSAKFQSTLADVTALMQQNNEKNCKLREDNLEMTKKFKSVCEQYELREQQVEKISKQLQLESQLADAKLSKAKMEMAAEKETLLREKQQLLMEVVECQAKIQDLQATETSLRSQISLYTNKYDEFQNALSRSNDVFEGFKGEMERMSKKICKLEKETSSWKQRWEKSHQALLEMAADKQQRDSELQLTTRQLAQLQKLCRTLQAERTSLLAQLKASAKPSTVEEAAAPPETDEKNTSSPNLDTVLSESQAVQEATPSAPVVEQPKQPPPVVEQPTPVVEQPVPVIEQPTPVVQQSVPVVEQSTPVVEVPVSEPKQQDVCVLKALSELALEVVPKTTSIPQTSQQGVPEVAPEVPDVHSQSVSTVISSPEEPAVSEASQPESNKIQPVPTSPHTPSIRQVENTTVVPTTTIAPDVNQLEPAPLVPQDSSSGDMASESVPVVSENAPVISPPADPVVSSSGDSPSTKNKSKEPVAVSKKGKDDELA